MAEVNKGTTSHQCPDCGQAMTVEECRVCNAIERERAREIPEIPFDGNSPFHPLPTILALDFWRGRAEKAEARAEAEFHRANTNEERLRIALEEIERLRGAIDWCIEEGAVLDFFTLQLFHPRVGIKIGGHPPGEYDTFLEAAEGYQKVVEWRRTSLASPRNSLEPPRGDKEER